MDDNVNLDPGILQYTRIFKSPYFYGSRRHGVQKYSVYNHHYHPRYYRDPVEEYWQLLDGVTLWDVGGAERQVEITGPDAFEFTNMLTPRNLEKCAVGQCKYAFITNAEGGIINDPVLLRLGENHFWLSLADSDVLLWAQGLAYNMGLNVEVKEPDVGPMQVQGPKSKEVMTDLFGEEILEVPYYYLVHRELEGMELVISRTGYSGELGYELYLKNASRDGLKPHPQDRRRHPGPWLRHVVRHQPLRGRLRLQVDGRAGAGARLRRKRGAEEDQRGGRQPQTGRRRDWRWEPRIVQ
jgi:glycine cleavage system aminomethyltransferase T